MFGGTAPGGRPEYRMVERNRMKVAVTLSFCLVLAFVASAQGAKKFTSLSDLSSHFEDAEEAATKKINGERLTALEAFVADKANEKSPDLGEARMAAARLAMELEKYDVAKKHAEIVSKDAAADVAIEGKAVLITATAKGGGATAAQLKEALEKFLADAPPEAVNLAYEAASSTAEALVDLDDLAAAKAAWKALGEKVTHPQIARVVQKATADLEEVGKDPKPFPETAKDLQATRSRSRSSRARSCCSTSGRPGADRASVSFPT